MVRITGCVAYLHNSSVQLGTAIRAGAAIRSQVQGQPSGFNNVVRVITVTCVCHHTYHEDTWGISGGDHYIIRPIHKKVLVRDQP